LWQPMAGGLEKLRLNKTGEEREGQKPVSLPETKDHRGKKASSKKIAGNEKGGREKLAIRVRDKEKKFKIN